MRQLTNIKPADIACEPEEDANAGHILSKVFDVLNVTDISYCVLHGYEDFSRDMTTDVDCMIDARHSARDLVRLLHENRAYIGADVVLCRGRYIVLGGKTSETKHCFVALDFAVHCDLSGVRYLDGVEILSSRRRHENFWIPSPDIAFAAYLVRTIEQRALTEVRARRLIAAFRQDPDGCARQIARFWNPPSVELLVNSARANSWAAVRAQIDSLAAELRASAIRRQPLRFSINQLCDVTARAARLLYPSGVNLAFLGPDGAGKSSVIAALPSCLAPLFLRHQVRGFAPGILSSLRRGRRDTSTPHALKPRSLAASLLRVGYWIAYHGLSYFPLRLALARSMLLLHDRSFVDVLVDQRRYRYGGPRSLLRLVWRLAPQPDLVILLDAPAEVLQQRKQEVPFAVTVCQRESYLALVRKLAAGRIVNAAQPFEQVVDCVVATVLQYLNRRVLRRYRLL